MKIYFNVYQDSADKDCIFQLGMACGSASECNEFGNYKGSKKIGVAYTNELSMFDLNTLNKKNDRRKEERRKGEK